jgi:hypothetical protein
MSESVALMVEKLENQLAQVILYIGAIAALSEAYRAHEKLQQDPFLFGTVYDGLWDAAVVRLGTIWDDSKAVASLPKLAKQLDRLRGAEAKAVAKEIKGAPTLEWARLKEWRHAIVAHARFPLDAASFDSKFSIGVEDLRRESERIEQLLARANECFGRQPVFYEVLKADAIANARNSLARWQSDAA